MSGRQHGLPGDDAAPTTAAAPAPHSPAAAFDLLYERNARALVRQTFLLCGSLRLARRSVAHAFRLAWRHWPQVAVDPDPSGWVRAAAHRRALAPWHHFRLVHLVRRGRAMRHVPPGDRMLLDTLLCLPRPQRAAVLLHDGLGLGLGDTAAEAEAGTAATAARLRHARAALAERMPELRETPPEELPRVTASLVRQLAAPQPAPLPPARRVRRGSEARAWGVTAASLGLTAAVAVAAVALETSDGDGDLPPLQVPKPPSATLAPDRQPGRLQPMVRNEALRTPPAERDGPAPLRHARGAGPFAVRA